MSKSSPDFDSLFKAEDELLTSKLKTARAAFPMHEYEKGASLENVARDFIRTFLPAEYGLGTGFIVWREEPKKGTRKSNGLGDIPKVVSPQLDIIIYDALRCSPIADLGTAQIFPIEAVYGYVEVKTTFKEYIEDILSVAKQLRGVNKRYYWKPRVEQHNTANGRVELKLDPNRVELLPIDACRFPQVRPSPFVFAFDYERNAPKKKPRTDADIIADFEKKWRSVGHFAHLYGVLIAGTGFLRSLPDHKREKEFTAELHRQNHVGCLKAQMLLDLSRKFRPPEGITIAYEGYLG